jgi:spore coat protein U-like protein
MVAFTAGASATTILPTVTFSLIPEDGFLAGVAGASVGWGYTIDSTNNGSPAFVFIESFSFGDATPIGAFLQPGVPFAGATDGSPITVPWSLNVSGLQYHIDASARVGASTQGAITLTYDVYSDAAQNDPIEFGLTVDAQMNGQDVNAEVVSTVPEPGAATLFVLGAVGLMLRRWSLSRPEPRQPVRLRTRRATRLVKD